MAYQLFHPPLRSRIPNEPSRLMIADELARLVRRELGFPPTADQQRAIATFCAFMSDGRHGAAMVLRGAAGTGKTTLAAAIVRSLAALRQRMVLLAPTGRAAKVFAVNTGHQAYTIHRRIYRQRSLAAEQATFSLGENLHADTLFIVDEASMIANGGAAESAFGSGCLLDDLVGYVYGGRNCRLMLVGDKAQLPPVGEDESPALAHCALEAYGLHAYEAELDEVVRQGEASGILFNATAIRRMITDGSLGGLPVVRLRGFADVCVVNGDELIESLASSYSRVGMDETAVITRSNKRANVYNRGIRAMVLGREEELTTGDLLLIVKNNYHWTELDRAARGGETASGGGAGDVPAFIANGDRAVVRRVRRIRSLYGFRFADVTLEFPDYDYYELTAPVLLDTLASDAPALTREQSDRLFEAVGEDYADLSRKADRVKAIRGDAHFNALQVKFAYAATCHKAQGGQWAHVYVDQGYMTADMLTPDYIHWLYTAFTRATERLFLVNWPREQIEDARE